MDEEGFPVHEAANRFLAEFGGLVIEIGGPGVNRAREPFEFDPALCRGESDRFIAWSQRIGKSLSPVGEFDHGRFFLGIDETATVYLVADSLASFSAMPEAIENMILGVGPSVVG